MCCGSQGWSGRHRAGQTAAWRSCSCQQILTRKNLNTVSSSIDHLDLHDCTTSICPADGPPDLSLMTRCSMTGPSDQVSIDLFHVFLSSLFINRLISKYHKNVMATNTAVKINLSFLNTQENCVSLHRRSQLKVALQLKAIETQNRA